MTVLLAAITYLDRVVHLGHADRDSARSRPRSRPDGRRVQRVLLAYAAFEIPTGWWGDTIRHPPGAHPDRLLVVGVHHADRRRVLLPLAGGIRFLFGAGEAGAWPNVARTFSRWFPLQERGTAQGIFFMGAHLAGGLTPLLVTALLAVRTGAPCSSCSGPSGSSGRTPGNAGFAIRRPNIPVGAVERDLIERGLAPCRARARSRTDWGRLLGNRTTVCLCLMYFTQTFGGAFYVTWLPTYLASRGLSGMTAGVLAGLPLTLSAAADLLGGFTTDLAARRFGLRLGRVPSAAARSPPRVASPLPARSWRARGGGGADFARRRLIELPPRRRVGNVHRRRRPRSGA